MTSQARRTYAGASEEERRSRRRAALLDATLDVVAAKGVKGLGVKAVCNAAALNDRYFYQQFRDCDEALMALYDHLIAECTGAISLAFATSEPEVNARLRACVGAAVDFVTVDPRRGRILIESQATEELRAKRQELVSGSPAAGCRRAVGGVLPTDGVDDHERGPRSGGDVAARGPRHRTRRADRVHDDLHHVRDPVVCTRDLSSFGSQIGAGGLPPGVSLCGSAGEDDQHDSQRLNH